MCSSEFQNERNRDVDFYNSEFAGVWEAVNEQHVHVVVVDKKNVDALIT